MVNIQLLSQGLSVLGLTETSIEKPKTLEEILGLDNLKKILGQPLTAENLHLLVSNMKLPGAVATNEPSRGP